MAAFLLSAALARFDKQNLMDIPVPTLKIKNRFT
jgi:hypothetical protein